MRAPIKRVEIGVVTLPEPAVPFFRKVAKERGVPAPIYVQQLFDVAYSARCRPTGDAELDAAVAAISGPAPASGGADQQRVHDLEALVASLTDQLALAKEDISERAKRAAEDAKSLAERDRRVRALEAKVADLRQAEADVRRLPAHVVTQLKRTDELAKLAGEREQDLASATRELREARAEIARLTEKAQEWAGKLAEALSRADAAERRAKERDETAANLGVTVHERDQEIARLRQDLEAAQQAPAGPQSLDVGALLAGLRDLMSPLAHGAAAFLSAVDEQQKRIGLAIERMPAAPPAQAPSMPPAPASSPKIDVSKSALRKAAVGLKAAGNSPAEIARAMRIPLADVKELLRAGV